MSFGSQLDINGGETPHEHVVDDTYTVGGHEMFETPVNPIRDGVHPGDTCPVCSRRVPFPKKESSPKSKPLAYRAPLDDYDSHLEAIDAAAEELGFTQSKYHRFVTVNYALACVLQGARLTETGS